MPIFVDHFLAKGWVRHEDVMRYTAIVGCLLYLTHTRPNIYFAVSMILRFMSCPSTQHMGATKRILWYVARTQGFGIMYTQVSKFKLIGCKDHD